MIEGVAKAANAAGSLLVISAAVAVSGVFWLLTSGTAPKPAPVQTERPQPVAQQSYPINEVRCPCCRRTLRVGDVDEYGDYIKCDCGQHVQVWSEDGVIKSGKVGG